MFLKKEMLAKSVQNQHFLPKHIPSPLQQNHTWRIPPETCESLGTNQGLAKDKSRGEVLNTKIMIQ